jgi:hypothetical protein
MAIQDIESNESPLANNFKRTYDDPELKGFDPRTNTYILGEPVHNSFDGTKINLCIFCLCQFLKVITLGFFIIIWLLLIVLDITLFVTSIVFVVHGYYYYMALLVVTLLLGGPLTLCGFLLQDCGKGCIFTKSTYRYIYGIYNGHDNSVIQI